MKMELPEIRPEERSPVVEALLAIIQQLLDRVQQLEEVNQQLRDENAILKGQKPRPKISPSRLESAKPPAQGPKRPGPPQCSTNHPCTMVPEEVVLLGDNLPPGAIFKGYEPYVFQELKIQAKVTRYWRAR